jgi:hypothetical protein
MSDYYDKLREEVMNRWRESGKREPARPTPEPVITEPEYKSFEDEMWTRRKEFDPGWFCGVPPFPVKTALDSLKQAAKLLEILLRYDMLSPEAIGFTSRKVSNVIKLLESLKEKLDAKP